MALVGKGNFLSLEPGQSVRCIASCAKPVSRPFRALAAGKCSNVGNLCSRSIHTRRVARVDEFEIFGISRVRQVRQRLRMQNRFMAQSDMVTPERGENEDATGAHATEKPMPERVAEIKGEPSSAFAVAIRNLGLNAMAGLLKPNRGKMFVIGPRSFVFQNPDHQVVMPTAEADVAFGLGRFELSIEEVRERVHNSLKAVGMDSYAQRPVQTLSGGQKQRIAIAGALAESSRLLLLDELTTYLDRGDQIGVLEAVRQVVGVEQKVTALWVTHRLEELEYADGAAYMENGRVVLSGSVAEIEAYIKRKQAQFYSEQEMLR
ncbi:hypothetical protein AXG93_2584s1060 [Marchantia polymorpha subsp. ruderalis]|uniref:ABC transporter domain-containing protein n=1 Tax=Marchantia polymorpha subsp. ruderalis TaxID=1480154 RepID=A0A176VI40_MARPO|nr:hypothetical protein AXG93_2584s1060 [Marchantia polymorpha subsp. ruderalis]